MTDICRTIRGRADKAQRLLDIGHDDLADRVAHVQESVEQLIQCLRSIATHLDEHDWEHRSSALRAAIAKAEGDAS